MAERLSVSYEYIKVKTFHKFIHNCIDDVVYDRGETAKIKLLVPKGLFVGTSLYFVAVR
jgi:hypothetical protein